jgi:hypothetical protein
MKARTAFLFARKKQETFASSGAYLAGDGAEAIKVFCFFFSKKKALLA